MKKTLLGIFCFFACMFSIHTQTLYGTTSLGGNDEGGTISNLIPATNNLTVAKSFESFAASPLGGLIEASNGKLYGMTQLGGSGYNVGDPYSGYGVIFSIDPSSSTYSKLKDFDGTNGGSPRGSLTQAIDGKLYGMTFSGGTSGLGVIFSFDPSSSIYTKLKDFDGTNGAYPEGSLIQASDGQLYGMVLGGSSGAGVIFSFDPSSSTYTKLKDLDDSSGAYPSGSLMQASDGKLYGMTQFGGSSGAGVIFSFDPSSSTYTKLKDFDGPTSGSPSGSLIEASDGKLYGVTSGGGSGGNGVIFSFDPSSSTYSKLKDFDVTGGGSPRGLTQAIDGKLYGMGFGGGASGLGVIFSFDPSSSIYTKLKDFDGTVGSRPYESLVQVRNGKLYGMTSAGGVSERGVIFSFDPASSTYTKLKDVGINESGSNVSASLMQTSDGKLYGMTENGGSSGYGAIFSFDPSPSTYTKLKDFDFTNGAYPGGSLIQASNGKLYGMTAGGGSSVSGVIFSFDPSTSTYTKFTDFDGTNGFHPGGSLMQASDGKLYGMAGGGSGGAGVIFSFDPASSTYTKLKEFDYSNGDGSNPTGSLMQASDGKLYGTTEEGGSSDLGVIFSYDPSSPTYTKLKDYTGANGANPYIGSAFIEVKATALPITLLTFSGEVQGKQNLLYWTTATEQNNTGFEMQRSRDGNNFSKIGFINTKAISGNSTAKLNYDFIDVDYSALTNYYRLKQIDKDGRYSYSNIVVLKDNNALAPGSITIYPNPVMNVLSVKIASSANDKVTLLITDINGKAIISNVTNAARGESIIQMNISHLSAGTYFLRAICGSGCKSEIMKFVKQ